MQADGRSEGSINVSSGSRQPPSLPEGRATPPMPPQSMLRPASQLVATAEPSQTVITHLRLPPSHAPPASRKIFAKRSQMTRLHVPRSQKSQQFSHLTPSCISQVGTEKQRGQETLRSPTVITGPLCLTAPAGMAALVCFSPSAPVLAPGTLLGVAHKPGADV